MAALLFSCSKGGNQDQEEKSNTKFKNEAHRMIYDMVQKVGNYDPLKDKVGVSYTYTDTSSSGKQDVSQEKYLFDGELSYGLLENHEKSFPNLQGPIEEGYDGENYWLKAGDSSITDPSVLDDVKFSRHTEFYWFAMFPKLLDPGLNYEYMGEWKSDTSSYDAVKVSFESPDDLPKDIYQVYINRNTGLVDHFLFTVVDKGKVDIPILARVAYENVEGILLPAYRKYRKSNWNAEVSEGPWTSVTWTDIRFDPTLSKEDFVE